MLFVKNLFVLALATIATCSPILPRDSALIVTDIAAAGQATKDFKTTVSAFNGGLVGGAGVLTAANKISAAVKKTGADATAEAPFDVAGSTAVSTAFNALHPDVEAALTALNEKEPIFRKNGFAATVKTTVTTLQSDSKNMFLALVAKVQDADKAGMTKTAQAMDAIFQASIAKFS